MRDAKIIQQWIDKLTAMAAITKGAQQEMVLASLEKHEKAHEYLQSRKLSEARAEYSKFQKEADSDEAKEKLPVLEFILKTNSK